MKNKFLIFLGMFALLFSACNPLENEIATAKFANNKIKPEIALDFVLGEDQYGFFGGDIETNSGFATVEEGRTSIPLLLASILPQAGANSVVNVTFDVFLFTPYEDDKFVTEYRSTQVSTQEYADLGFTFGNFSNPTDIDTYMQFKYPNGVITADDGSTITTIKNSTAIKLTYLYYSDSLNEETNIVYYLDGKWRLADYVLTNNDYDAMGNGQYNNFGYENGVIEANTKIPVFLGTDLYKFNNTPIDYLTIQYDNDIGDGVISKRLNFYSFDGKSGSLFNGKLTYNEAFGYNISKNIWEGDNTIKYALTTDDYASIAAKAIADGTTNTDATLLEAGENLQQYGSFNLSNWTDLMLVTAIGTRLLELFTTSDEGQKYLVSYDFYDGNAGNTTVKLILANGVYVKFSE